MLHRVLIPTQRGEPSRVVSLIGEAPDAGSYVVWGARPGEDRAMSAAYDRFVGRGGVIARDFGSADWVLSIDPEISDGDSWQLGVYLAHLLLATTGWPAWTAAEPRSRPTATSRRPGRSAARWRSPRSATSATRCG